MVSNLDIYAICSNFGRAEAARIVSPPLAWRRTGSTSIYQHTKSLAQDEPRPADLDHAPQRSHERPRPRRDRRLRLRRRRIEVDHGGP